MTAWWVRWSHGSLVRPLRALPCCCWQSGSTMSGSIDYYVAALHAPTAEVAKQRIRACYEQRDRSGILFSTCDPKPVGWSPFCNRFPRERGMRWQAHLGGDAP